MGREQEQKQPEQRDPGVGGPDIKDPPSNLPDYEDPPVPEPVDPVPPKIKAREFDPNDLSNYMRGMGEPHAMLYQIQEPGMALHHMRDPMPSEIAYR
jgi:hypothetical protein